MTKKEWWEPKVIDGGNHWAIEDTSNAGNAIKLLDAMWDEVVKLRGKVEKMEEAYNKGFNDGRIDVMKWVNFR